MSAPTILLALGGNAILQAGQKATYKNQLANVATSARFLAQLVQDGYRLALTHGNGPQVGNLLRQNEEAKEVIPPMPLDVLSGQSQGLIGYMLQQCLAQELTTLGRPEQVACILSRVLVDGNDPAFKDPAKPVGIFYDEATAQSLAQEKGWQVRHEASKGWRRVVPSPKPQKIIEKDAILSLLHSGFITISCGGGGIPVVATENGYQGVEAVIDKDLTGACLAEAIQADSFLIVTDVEHAFINFGTESQQALHHVSIQDMEAYQQAGQFSRGSMGPKVEAAIRFVRRTNKPALICALSSLDKALAGNSGTHILPKR